jgi:type II secretion system protein H
MTGGFRKDCRPGEQGFTLMELLIAMCLMGILVAISVPTLKNMRQSQSHKETARYIASTLRRARAAAISTNNPQMVIFKPNSSCYRWVAYNSSAWNNAAPVQSMSVPAAVTMRSLSAGTSAANVYVLFNTNSTVSLKSQSGVASDGNISLNNGATQKFMVTVSNYTGRVAITKF